VFSGSRGGHRHKIFRSRVSPRRLPNHPPFFFIRSKKEPRAHRAADLHEVVWPRAEIPPGRTGRSRARTKGQSPPNKGKTHRSRISLAPLSSAEDHDSTRRDNVWCAPTKSAALLQSNVFNAVFPLFRESCDRCPMKQKRYHCGGPAASHPHPRCCCRTCACYQKSFFGSPPEGGAFHVSGLPRPTVSEC